MDRSDEVLALIEQYRAAWERIVRETHNVDEVNQFFHPPCIFVGADGSASLFGTPEDISTFHRARLEGFGSRKESGLKCSIMTTMSVLSEECMPAGFLSYIRVAQAIGSFSLHQAIRPPRPVQAHRRRRRGGTWRHRHPGFSPSVGANFHGRMADAGVGLGRQCPALV